MKLKGKVLRSFAATILTASADWDDIAGEEQLPKRGGAWLQPQTDLVTIHVVENLQALAATRLTFACLETSVEAECALAGFRK